MLKSLRMRIVLVLTLLIVAVMAVVGTFLINSVSSFYDSDFIRQMEEVFSNEEFRLSLADSLSAAEPSGSLNTMMAAYAGMLGVDSYRDYYILSRDGQFLTGSNIDEGRNLAQSPNLLRAMAGETGGEIVNSSAFFDYAVPVGDYIIYVKDTKEELKEIIWVMFAIIIQALFFGLVIAIALSFFLAKAITKPVENITKGAKLMEEGNLSLQLPVMSKDEIGTLTQTFNSMAGTLKRTMQEIDEERGKLESIFYYLTDGVIASTKEGKLLHINKAAQELLGFQTPGPDACLEDLLAPFELDLTLNDLQALERGDMVTREITTPLKILESIFARFDIEGAQPDELSGGYIVVIHDVTEKRAFENSTREFVANVSHELRTPLTSIKSYTETVLETPDLPPELHTKFLTVVINEADRMTRIVKDLLLLSRLDNHKMDWQFTQFPLQELMDNIYDSMLMDAKSHGHRLIQDVSVDLGLIFGDRERLEQAIINIVSNAIKYTPDGGEIKIKARRADGRFEITVRDNGIGIPEEDVPRLFERFYRVDKARSRERGGTGLGLAITKEIVAAHQGVIEVKSILDKGTRITISLPVNPQQESAGKEAQNEG